MCAVRFLGELSRHFTGEGKINCVESCPMGVTLPMTAIFRRLLKTFHLKPEI